MRTASIASTAAVALAATALLAGCATPPATDGGAAAGPTAEEVLGTWVLQEDFPSAPETPYLAFAEEDAWLGSDGCNTTEGTWVLGEDGAVEVTAGPSTLIACDGAPLPSLLAAATSFALDGDTLTITGPAGDTVLVRSDDPAVGPQDPVGLWGSEEAGEPFVELDADGGLSGSDGCNTFAGTWALSDGQLRFLDVAATLMACEGVDTWLSGASFAVLQGGTMTVYAEDGTQLGQLDRSA